MKHYILSVFLFFILSNSYSQNDQKIILGYAPTIEKVGNENAFLDFKSTYNTNVDNVKWCVSKEITTVYFTYDGMQCRVFYNKEGEKLALFKYYEGKFLSKKIADQIFSKFRNYRISIVTEAYNKEEIKYYIKIENNKTWKMILIDNGDMEITEDYPKL